jgi:hypothetical protein
VLVSEPVSVLALEPVLHSEPVSVLVSVLALEPVLHLEPV